MGNSGDSFNTAVGHQIRAEFSGAGFNMKSFAEHAGINYKTLDRYIKGERPIPMTALFEIADALGLSAQTLIARATERFEHSETRAIVTPLPRTAKSDPTRIKDLNESELAQAGFDLAANHDRSADGLDKDLT